MTNKKNSLKKTLTLLAISLSSFCAFHANADYSQAQQQLANGDYEQSFPQLLQLAKLGNSRAQLALAQSYASGYGTEQDFTQAYVWSLMAMDNHHPDAKAHYLQVRRQTPSKRQAKSLYQSLSDRYGVEALDNNLYPQANSIYRNLIKPAMEKYTPQPEYPDVLTQGETAAWAVVEFNVNPSGVTDNVHIVASYPEETIDKYVLSAVAQWQFELQYDDHNKPLSYPSQRRLFQLSATSEEAKAHFERQNSAYLAQLQQRALTGSGAHQYLVSALMDLELVSTQNNTKTDTPLGWLTKAAINGYGKAQYELFQCLSAGGGCLTDENKAVQWLKMASEQGNKNAMFFLVNAYLNPDGNLVDYSPTAAMSLLQQLVKTNYLPALTLYSQLLASSEQGGIRDPQKAIKYAHQAMALDNNNPDLLATLGIAYFELGRVDKGQEFLLQAIHEADLRRWTIDYYVDVLEDYQLALLQVK